MLSRFLAGLSGAASQGRGVQDVHQEERGRAQGGRLLEAGQGERVRDALVRRYAWAASSSSYAAVATAAAARTSSSSAAAARASAAAAAAAEPGLHDDVGAERVGFEGGEGCDLFSPFALRPPCFVPG